MMENKNPIRIGIVIAIIIVVLTLVYITTHRPQKTVETQNSFMTLIAEKAPNDYAIYMNKVKENREKNGSPDNEVFYIAEMINNLLIQYGPNASNQSLYDFLKSNVDYDKKLFSIDPTYVLFHEYPDKFKDKIDFKKLDESEYKNNVLGSVEAVIKSGMENPQPLPTETEVKQAEAIFRGVITDLSKKYDTQLIITSLQHPEDPKLDKKVAAQIIIDFYDTLLSKGEDAVGLVLKASLMLNRVKR